MVLWAFLALSSAIFFAIKDILAKKLFKKNVQPLQLVFEEYLLLLLICMAILFPQIQFETYSQYWHLYILKALAIGSATLFYFEMLKKFPISHVSPILNLSPLILLVLSGLILAESISFLQLIGVLVIIVSTYALEIVTMHHRKSNPNKHHFSLIKQAKSSFLIMAAITLVTMSFAAIFDRMILEVVDVYTNLFFTSSIILVVLFFYYLKESYLKTAMKNIIEEPETLVIAIFTIVSNVLVLLAIAIPTALVSLIIPLRRTSTLFSAIFGGLLFHERHIRQKSYATAGMLMGIILIVV